MLATTTRVVAALALVAVIGCEDQKKSEPASENSKPDPASSDQPLTPTVNDGKPALGGLKAPVATAKKVERAEFVIADIPAELEVKGKVFRGLRFTDKNGDNWVLFSKRQASSAKDLGTVSEYLNVNHFAIGSVGAKKLRLVRDKVENCDLDLLLNVSDASLDVTDLDDDGFGEVSFGYELACAGDISPATFKFLLLENGDKYIIRGSTKVVLKGTTPMGGDRKIDKSFLEGPAAFKDYAVRKWPKLIVRRLD